MNSWSFSTSGAFQWSSSSFSLSSSFCALSFFFSPSTRVKNFQFSSNKLFILSSTDPHNLSHGTWRINPSSCMKIILSWWRIVSIFLLTTKFIKLSHLKLCIHNWMHLSWLRAERITSMESLWFHRNFRINLKHN